jgi:hypothetical protein
MPTERPPLVGEVVPTFADRGCRVSAQRIPAVVILNFLDRSRYFFFQVAPQLSSRGWVDPVPDPAASQNIWKRRESNPGPLYLKPETLTELIEMQNGSRPPTVLTEGFRGIPQSLLANSGEGTQYGYNRFLPKSFPVYYLSIILKFYAIWSRNWQHRNVTRRRKEIYGHKVIECGS